MGGSGIAAILRSLLLWLLFILAESFQGGLRRWLFGPQVAAAVHVASVLAGVAMIFAITWFGWRWMRLRSAAAALSVGVFWVALTTAFDLALGRMLGASWAALAADYDPRRGGVMAIGLLAMAVTPWTVARLKAGAPSAD